MNGSISITARKKCSMSFAKKSARALRVVLPFNGDFWTLEDVLVDEGDVGVEPLCMNPEGGGHVLLECECSSGVMETRVEVVVDWRGVERGRRIVANRSRREIVEE
jgi:hypothetical protein